MSSRGSMFPYNGGLGQIADSLANIILAQKPTMFYDALAGGCRLTSQIARRGVPIQANDLNFYAVVNGRALFEPYEPLDPTKAVGGFRQGALSTMTSFGYWSETVREAIDSLCAAHHHRSDVLAAVSRVLIGCSFRGVSWSDKLPDGRYIPDLGLEWLQDAFVRAYNLIQKRRTPHSMSRVWSLDVERFLLDITPEPRSIVFIDAPWPWKKDLNNSGAYDFYQPINQVLLQDVRHTDLLSWDKYPGTMWEEVVRPGMSRLLGMGVTVALIKQNLALPAVTEADLPGRVTYHVTYPIRGGRGDKLPGYFEDFWLLRQ